MNEAQAREILHRRRREQEVAKLARDEHPGPPLNHFRLFPGWEREELRDLAAALDAAWGEGVECEALGKALVDEANHREMKLPYAYEGEGDPTQWLKNLIRF